MPPRKQTSGKAEAGRARKAEQAALKAEKTEREREAQEAKEWQKGADLRGQARAEAAASKADEAARKRREKAELLAAEEEALGSAGKPKKTPTLSKKKTKKKNDLSLLEDALIGAAEKKTKAKKKADLLRKEKEAATVQQSAQGEPLDPLLQNTNAMLEGAAGRELNKKSMDLASGLDAALDTLDVSSGGNDVKRRKALFLAFEEKMLPVVKEDHPGLRLTQYKEKVFNLWKKSPENPANQTP